MFGSEDHDGHEINTGVHIWKKMLLRIKISSHLPLFNQIILSISSIAFSGSVLYRGQNIRFGCYIEGIELEVAFLPILYSVMMQGLRLWL